MKFLPDVEREKNDSRQEEVHLGVFFFPQIPLISCEIANLLQHVTTIIFAQNSSRTSISDVACLRGWHKYGKRAYSRLQYAARAQMNAPPQIQVVPYFRPGMHAQVHPMYSFFSPHTFSRLPAQSSNCRWRRTTGVPYTYRQHARGAGNPE